MQVLRKGGGGAKFRNGGGKVVPTSDVLVPHISTKMRPQSYNVRQINWNGMSGLGKYT